MRLRRKVCLLGASGVGKTSLARRLAEGEIWGEELVDEVLAKAHGKQVAKR